jgi:tetratricopeptide (TPR) repeat protein
LDARILDFGLKKTSGKLFQQEANIIKDDYYKGQFDRAVRLTKTLAAHDDLLSPLAGEYAAAGRFDLAVELANSIKNEYWKQPALLKIVEEYVAAGKYTEALEFAGAVQSKEVKIRALRAMAQKYAEAGEYARALEEYHQALEVAKTIQPPPEYPPEAIHGIEEYSIPLIKCSLGQS